MNERQQLAIYALQVVLNLLEMVKLLTTGKDERVQRMIDAVDQWLAAEAPRGE